MISDFENENFIESALLHTHFAGKQFHFADIFSQSVIVRKKPGTRNILNVNFLQTATPLTLSHIYRNQQL